MLLVEYEAEISSVFGPMSVCVCTGSRGGSPTPVPRRYGIDTTQSSAIPTLRDPVYLSGACAIVCPATQDRRYGTPDWRREVPILYSLLIVQKSIHG